MVESNIEVAMKNVEMMRGLLFGLLLGAMGVGQGCGLTLDPSSTPSLRQACKAVRTYSDASRSSECLDIREASCENLNSFGDVGHVEVMIPKVLSSSCCEEARLPLRMPPPPFRTASARLITEYKRIEAANDARMAIDCTEPDQWPTGLVHQYCNLVASDQGWYVESCSYLRPSYSKKK